ncbi:ROK family transcriptional regulator [Rubripirellula lacrimiformis]|nr:ROK family transcriptional regulator [Rubripirellula lacrimiformis]
MIEPVSSDPKLLSQMNQRAVLRILQSHGPQSRAEVTRLIGATRPTVSKAVASLLQSGLLEEFESPQATRGRPAKKLRLGGEASQIIGLVVDSPNCRIVAAGLDGELRPQTIQAFATPCDYDQLLRMFADCVAALCGGRMRTLGIGISVPGLFDYREGRSILSPNVPVTNGRCLAADLSARLGVECTVLQESDALCLAERHFGLATDLGDFAMLDASTGLGLGVMIAGELLKGSSGLAGEIGHLPMVPDGVRCGCGRSGCLETIASDTALARVVSDRLGEVLNIEQVVQRVRDGEIRVDRELRWVSQGLVFALVTAINLFNPETLFVHSRMLDLDDNFLDQLIRETESKALVPAFRNCRILRARGSKREGAIAGSIEHLTNSRITV